MTGDELTKAALRFAAEAHHGQKRKYSDEPFILHPMRVADAVSEHPMATPEMVAAAYLHDVLEDTPVTVAQLRELFGAEVAGLVVELTNPSRNFPNLLRAVRKQMDIDHLAQASIEAQVIKLYDRLKNLEEMEDAPKKFKRLYAEESIDLAKALEDADTELASEVTGLALELIEEAEDGH